MIKQPITRRLKKTNLLIFIITSICLGGCINTNAVYDSSQNISVDGWSKKDSLIFEDLPISSNIPFNYELNIRHGNDYPYQNIGLLVHYMKSDSILIRTDTLNIPLTNNSGSWLGKGWGSLYQRSYIIQRNKLLINCDKIIIIPNMNVTILKGVDAIGLEINQ